MIEAVGIAAFITNVVGNLLLARKSERGWWVRIVSIVLWFFYARNTASLAMTLNSVTFFGINIYGLIHWRRERRVREKAGDDGPDRGEAPQTDRDRASGPHRSAPAGDANEATRR